MKGIKKTMHKFLKEIFKRFYINKKRLFIKNISLFVQCTLETGETSLHFQLLICSQVRKPQLYKKKYNNISPLMY